MDINPISYRECSNLFTVIETIPLGDYTTLLKKLENNCCDDIQFFNYDIEKMNLIRYKDRIYGEKIRAYHLTKEGFFHNIHEELLLLLDEVRERNRHSEGSNEEITSGSASDNQIIKILNNYLDSYQKGVIMELKTPNGIISRRRNANDYNIIGELCDTSYLEIIDKLREGICDDVLYKYGSGDVDLIQYKDRDFGEYIRKYHLTKRGFYLHLMQFFDDD